MRPEFFSISRNCHANAIPMMAVTKNVQLANPALYSVNKEVMIIAIVWNQLCFATSLVVATTGNIGIPAAA